MLAEGKSASAVMGSEVITVLHPVPRLVVVGFAGLSPTRAAGGTPAWIWASLALGLVGMVATWAWTARAARRPTGLYARIDDGADGIRRNLRLFDDIERFERD